MSPVTKPAAIITRPAAEAAMRDLASSTHNRDQILAEMELELTEVRAKYEVPLLDWNRQIDDLETALKSWAKANRAEFGEAQSLDLIHGSLEYRVGNPTLVLIGKTTWDDVLLNLTLLKLLRYIRQVVEVDKVKLLADRGDLGEQLEAIGCRVKQTEKLSIIVKSEEIS